MSRGTTHHSVRIDDELWKAAQETARERGESLSEVIRRALATYVKQADS